MTLDEIYEVDLSKCDFSYMTEEEIKNYLIGEFLKNCDKESVRVEVVSDKEISQKWLENAISKTIESYEIEFGRELTREELNIIHLSYLHNTFDHDEKLMSIQNQKQKKQQK